MKRALSALKFLVPVLVFITPGCGNSASDTKTDSVADTVAVSEPVNIPGTHVFMSMPDGYDFSDGFIGIQKNTYTAIIVAESPGENYYTNAGLFSATAFQQKGLRVLEYEEFQFNGYPAKLALLQGNLASQSYQLIFGDSTFAVMLSGTFPADSTQDKYAIKRAMVTTKYDKTLQIDYSALATFTVADTVSRFLFSKVAGGVYFYTLDGDPARVTNDPFVSVMGLPGKTKYTGTQIADMMMNGLMQTGFQTSDVRGESTEKVNGYDTYEREVYGTMNGQNAVVYQLILVSNGRALAVQGVSKSNFKKDLADFRAFAYAVRFKDK